MNDDQKETIFMLGEKYEQYHKHLHLRVSAPRDEIRL